MGSTGSTPLGGAIASGFLRQVVSLLTAAAVLGGCAPSLTSSSSMPKFDMWAVWVCRVPTTSHVATYADGPLGGDRLPLKPEQLVAVLDEHVRPWFDRVSYGRYRLQFRVGGELRLSDADGPQECLDRVRSAARGQRATDGVLAIADAAHRETERGGFATVGAMCATSRCPAGESGRGVYVGAADFHPGWGDVPALDLVEHELGHALGWTHSGVDTDGRYTSGIDLMSDSAALRSLDPDQRHGPPPLAVHRVGAGWIPPGDVRELALTTPEVEVELAPTAEPRGTRLLRLPIDGYRWLAVEVIDDPLAAPIGPGVTVHLVTPTALTPLVGAPPYTSLLGAGDSWARWGWKVEVLDVPAPDEPVTWRLRVTRSLPM